MPVNSTTGYPGVSFHKGSGKYQAIYNSSGVPYLVGYFTTIEEAAEIRAKFIEIFVNDYKMVLQPYTKNSIQSYIRAMIEDPHKFYDLQANYDAILELTKDDDSSLAKSSLDNALYQLQEAKREFIRSFEPPKDILKLQAKSALARRQAIQAKYFKK